MSWCESSIIIELFVRSVLEKSKPASTGLPFNAVVVDKGGVSLFYYVTFSTDTDAETVVRCPNLGQKSVL